MSKILNKIIDPISLEIKWDEVWKIPEFEILKTVEQNPYWHDEIYVSQHIKKMMLEPYNAKIIYVYIEAPTFQDNLERRKGQIPENIIIKMRDNFEFPKMTECEQLIINKQSLEWFKTFY